MKKVAIICDWLVGIGGAEKVILELHRIYPEAPIYTSQYDPNKLDWFTDADVRTLWLQHLPKFLKKFLPPFRAFAFSRLDLSEYDLVISSTGAEAKGVRRLKSGAKHISYIQAPTHYYWSRYEEYLKNPGFGRLDPIARIGLKILVGPLRRWDYKAAQRPDLLLANSTHTQQQIMKYYGRESEVLHPPVDIERFSIPHIKHDQPNVRKGFVVTGRQTPYKRIDLAVAACTELNVPLIVIGKGPEHRKLKKMAGKTITFLTKVTNHELPHYLQSAEAFIFPTNVEDFGMAPIEALAAGTPVIAYKAGGPLDYIQEGVNGTFFEEQTVQSLANKIKSFDSSKYSSGDIKASAKSFSEENFQKSLHKIILNVLQ